MSDVESGGQARASGLQPARVWVRDEDWQPSGAPHRCRLVIRGRQCPNEATFSFPRGSTRVRWHYCSQHLYGRVAVDGAVWTSVHPDSPMAKSASEIRYDLDA